PAEGRARGHRRVGARDPEGDRPGGPCRRRGVLTPAPMCERLARPRPNEKHRPPRGRRPVLSSYRRLETEFAARIEISNEKHWPPGGRRPVPNPRPVGGVTGASREALAECRQCTSAIGPCLSPGWGTSVLRCAAGNSAQAPIC